MRAIVRTALSVSALSLMATALTVTPASAAAPPAFGYGPMTFTNSAAPAAFFSAPFAGEPSLGINGKTGAALYMAGTDVYKVGVNAATSPVGISWANVTPLQSLANADPILATDRVTGLTFAGGDTGPCGALFTSTNDGGTWGNSAACVGTTDHPTVGSGPSAPGGGALPVAGNGRTAYFCQQQDLNMCSASLDGGQTWAPGVPQQDCLGLFGHVKIDTAGTAYVPSVNCFDNAAGVFKVGGFYSNDNGQNWASYTIPDAPVPARGFDAQLAITPDRTLYESWSDAGNHTMVTSSKTHGTTWSPQVDLASTVSPPMVAATFQTVTAGDNGRVSIAYLGTQVGTPGVSPYDSGYHGIWYLWVSTTLDGGQTWSTVKATPEPVQRGSISDGGTASQGQRNLLDFIDAQTLNDGRVAVAYADGCLDVCNGPAGTEAQSTAQYATIAVQDTGRGLFAAQDVIPVTPPSAPVLTGSTSGSSNSLAWTVADDGGAPVTSYTVNRAVGSGAFATVATTTDPSYVDSPVTAGTTYRYTVTATNSAGPSVPSSPLSLLPTTVPSAPTLTATGGSSKVTLTWTPPDNGGSAITGYQVLRGATASSATLLATVGSVTSYVDSTAVPGTSYAYRLAAVNANGASALSAPVAAISSTVPGAPTLKTTAGKGTVTLTWTTPSDGYSPITSWTILRGTTSGSEVVVQTITNGTTYVDPGLTGGTTYFYKVVANNANGGGAPSNESSATARKTR
jgi:hypothetical protein